MEERDLGLMEELPQHMPEVTEKITENILERQYLTYCVASLAKFKIMSVQRVSRTLRIIMSVRMDFSFGVLDNSSAICLRFLIHSIGSALARKH